MADPEKPEQENESPGPAGGDESVDPNLLTQGESQDSGSEDVELSTATDFPAEVGRESGLGSLHVGDDEVTIALDSQETGGVIIDTTAIARTESTSARLKVEQVGSDRATGEGSGNEEEGGAVSGGSADSGATESGTVNVAIAPVTVTSTATAAPGTAAAQGGGGPAQPVDAPPPETSDAPDEGGDDAAAEEKKAEAKEETKEEKQESAGGRNQEESPEAPSEETPPAPTPAPGQAEGGGGGGEESAAPPPEEPAQPPQEPQEPQEPSAPEPEPETPNSPPSSLNIDLADFGDELEDGELVANASATDPDPNDVLAFGLLDNSDDRFTIDSETGEITVVPGAEFDDNENISLVVEVTDLEGLSITQTVDFVTPDTNEAPDIATTVLSASENQTAAGRVEAADPDAGDDLSFAITGGADAGALEIDAETGELTFTAAPDFEAPADADGDNTYEVEVTVTDAQGLTDIQTIEVSVTDVDENRPPAIQTTAASIIENDTFVVDVAASDPDGDELTFAISGEGADDSLFTIDEETGALVFNAAPDFESPADADGDNVYEVEVIVTDEAGATDVQTIEVTVTDENEAPDIETDDFSIDENQISAGTVIATDPDAGDELTFAITGGDDANDLRIDSETGEITFKQAPDFEKPKDKDKDNIYEVEVTVTDKDGATDIQVIEIAVNDVEEEDDDGKDKNKGKGHDHSGSAGETDDGHETDDPHDHGKGAQTGDDEHEEEEDEDHGRGRGGDDDDDEDRDDDEGGRGRGRGGDNDGEIDDEESDDFNEQYARAFGNFENGDDDQVIQSDAGSDEMRGGSGDDIFVFSEGHGDDFVFGMDGDDTIDLQGLGEYGEDWTLVLEDGSAIDNSGEDYIELTSESAGTIVFNDGTEIAFEGIERIDFGDT